MKKIILLIIILIVQLHLQAQNQEKITEDFKIYQVKLWIKGTTSLIKGVLYSVDDSTLTISKSSSKYDYIDGNYTTTVYRLDQILEVTSSRNGGGTGLILGLVGGGVIGGVIGKGKNYGFHQTTNRKIARYATIGGFVSGTLGLIIGRKWIRGVPEPNSKMLWKLKRRAIKR